MRSLLAGIILAPATAATVKWGGQTWDEMIFAWVGLVVMSVGNGNAANSSPKR